MTKEEVIEELNRVEGDVDAPWFDDETTEQHRERMQRSNLAVKHAISMLTNATIWTPCTERMPTVEDADDYGDVNTIDHDGTTCFLQWDEVEFAINVYAWSRIEAIGGGNG